MQPQQNNIAINLSGNQVMSSNDANGIGRTVYVYAPLLGSGNLTTAGNGNLIFAGSNTTYTGQITISSGSAQLGDNIAQNGSLQVNFANNGTLIFANPNPQTFGNVISGNGSVAMTGTGGSNT